MNEKLLQMLRTFGDLIASMELSYHVRGFTLIKYRRSLICLLVFSQIDPFCGPSTAICLSCEKSLISSHVFRLKCQQSNKRWLQFNMKAEDEGDDKNEDATTGHSIVIEQSTDALLETISFVCLTL